MGGHGCSGAAGRLPRLAHGGDWLHWLPSPGGLANDWHMSIKETLFERPYIVNSGAELIAAISAGMDPSQVGGGGGGMQAAMLPVGVPMTYCRATAVGKERGQIKPTSDWAK